jgi:hypothetical protein
MWHIWGRREGYTGCWWRSLRERGHWGDPIFTLNFHSIERNNRQLKYYIQKQASYNTKHPKQVMKIKTINILNYIKISIILNIKYI